MSESAPTSLSLETKQLLTEIQDLLNRHVVFTSEAQSLAVALFVLNTYVFDVFDVTPYLAITSAEKRSGKSRLLEMLALVVRNPWKTTHPTGPLLFRTIDDLKPTLLLDEVDSTPRDRRDDILTVLNAGFVAGTPVNRLVEVKGSYIRLTFDIYSPKALAGIGTFLSDTTLDRSIIVKLRRKLSGEDAERFRLGKMTPATQPLRDRLNAWMEPAREVLTLSQPALPEDLDDRKQDIWEPLLAVADLAGKAVGTRARAAAVELSGVAEDSDGEGTMLLRHIREVFEDDENVDRGTPNDPAHEADWKITSADLVTALTNREDWPWSMVFPTDTQRAKTVLASMLGRFEGTFKPGEGIKPQKVSVRGKKLQGYRQGWFADAWTRYLGEGGQPPGTAGTAGTVQLTGGVAPEPDPEPDPLDPEPVPARFRHRFRPENALTSEVPAVPAVPAPMPKRAQGDEDLKLGTLPQTPHMQSVNAYCANNHGATLRPEQLAEARCPYCNGPYVTTREAA